MQPQAEEGPATAEQSAAMSEEITAALPEDSIVQSEGVSAADVDLVPPTPGSVAPISAAEEANNDNLSSHLIVKSVETPETQPLAVTEPAVETTKPTKTEASPQHPPRCFSRAQLTLPDVLPGERLAITIGEQRKALVGEFDTGNTEPAIALAKSYLSVGMLHEARTLIEEFAHDDALGQFMLDVANSWAGEVVSRSGSLFKDECIGIQALWRAYAQARAGDVDAALKSEISSGSALEELPLHPRQVVGAELGLIAASRGQWDSARRLSAMVRRAADGSQETLGKTHLLSFRLAKWRNDEAEAEEHLAKAATSDVDTATEALLIKAEEALRSENVLDPSQTALRMDLGNLARREIGSEVAKRAFNLEARLFNRQAGADETISFLSDAVSLGLLDAAEHPQFLSDLISKPAYSDVARPLAHIYLENPAQFEEALEQNALRRSVIRSLAREGVPGIARTLASNDDLKDPDLVAELANSFVDAGEYREAIAAISKADVGVSQQIALSRAFLGMGDFEKAIASLNDLPDRESLSSVDRETSDALRLEAELAGKDFASALSTSVEKLNDTPSRDLAAQSAIIALETGTDGIPEAARQILEQDGSEELDALEQLYPLVGANSLSNIESTDELDEILKGIESSEQAIREVLENG